MLDWLGLAFPLSHHLGEFSPLIEFHNNIATAHKLPVNIDLRKGGPLGKLFHALAQFWVLENIKGGEGFTESLKHLYGCRRESALGRFGRAFHVDHDPIAFDLGFNFSL
jgi:hypothetical protein